MVEVFLYNMYVWRNWYSVCFIALRPHLMGPETGTRNCHFSFGNQFRKSFSDVHLMVSWESSWRFHGVAVEFTIHNEHTTTTTTTQHNSK